MSMLNNHIIGGMFGLPASIVENSKLPPFISKKSVFLANARSGVFLLTETLRPRRVWVPSYLCHTILDGARKAGGSVEFYAVNYDLRIDSYDWIKEVGDGDLVVLIDYFGWTHEKEHIDLIKERGAWVLEDASQALLSGNVGQFSDFVVYSPRKFVGIPDGGILCINCDVHFQGVEFETPPSEWWLSAFLASLLRREFDIYGGTRSWFELFQKTEPNSPIGPFAMSELSRVLLLNSFDYSTIAQRRVDNYQALADKLGSLALFPCLPDQIVPLGFPICTKERDKVRQALFAQDIYPPVHWLIQGRVPQYYGDSHKLASEIMTLSCDQRYDREDMDRVARLVAEVLEW